MAIRRFRLPGGPAAIGVASAFVGIPLAAYGVQIYPELPAALAVITAVAVLSSPRRTWRHEVAAIAAVVALPWLAVKYVPVAAVLAVAVLIGARSEPAPVPSCSPRRCVVAGARVPRRPPALVRGMDRVRHRRPLLGDR